MTLVDYQEGGKLAQVLTAAPDSHFVVAGSGGCGFIAAVGDMVGRNKAGKSFLSLEKGETPVVPAPLGKVGAGDTAPTEQTAVAVLSSSGRLLLFPFAELKVMAKGKGLVLIDLAKGEELVGTAVTTQQALQIGGIGRGGKAANLTLSVREQVEFRGNRARRGHELPSKIKPTGIRVD